MDNSNDRNNLFEDYGAPTPEELEPDASAGRAESDNAAQEAENSTSSAGADIGYNYGSSAYNSNTYSTNNFGNPTYGSTVYSSYYGDPYTKVGGTPVDETGQPLKNRFGMKIVFSILEILSCCLCNPVSLILGILGCVFTCSANTSYKQGKTEEFKKNAKVSAIMLWIGFAVDVIAIIIWGVFLISSYIVGQAAVESGEIDNIMEYYEKYLDDDYDYNYDYDYDYDYDVDDFDLDDFYDSYNFDWDDYMYNYSDPAAVGDYWKFQLEGISYELPVKLSDFLQAGYLASSEDDSEYTVEAKDLDYLEFYDAGGEFLLGFLEVYNPTDRTASVNDCMIIGISVSNPQAYGDDYILDMEIANGIRFGSTQNEVRNAFGEPGYWDDEDGYLYEEWAFDENDENKILMIEYDGDNTVSDITICYPGDYNIFE